MMNHRLSTGWVWLAAALLPLSAASARRPHATDALALVDRFEAARRDFDPAALAQTLAPDFIEISPRGEVDPHDKVLGFYDPSRRQPVPPMSSDETAIRSVGDTALVTRRLSISLPGTSGRRSIRALYVAHRMAAGWRLVSAQYTPMPPEPAQ